MRVITKLTIALSIMLTTSAFADGWDPHSNAPNNGGISNTRHNMNMSYGEPAVSRGDMNNSINFYDEVCVYCHTPHGSDTSTAVPLWNRRIGTGTYTLYDKPLSSGQTVTTPGAASLTCLSCHDGTIAIDSVINMPTSGKVYYGSDAPSESFLDAWDGTDRLHRKLSPLVPNADPNLSPVAPADSCLFCHQGPVGSSGGGSFGAFTVFAIGEDLTNDHPVGVEFPAADHPTATDFKQDGLKEIAGKAKYFDKDGNSKMGKAEVRMYSSGSGTYEVECASCHDPHGVMPNGGTEFNPSFLRVANSQSALCLTCHDK